MSPRSNPSSEIVRATCEFKQAFASPEAADKVAKSMRRRKRRVQSYRCPFCRKWHVGEPSS